MNKNGSNENLVALKSALKGLSPKGTLSSELNSEYVSLVRSVISSLERLSRNCLLQKGVW